MNDTLSPILQIFKLSHRTKWMESWQRGNSFINQAKHLDDDVIGWSNFVFFFHAGPLTGNAPLPDNQIHFANEFSKIFPLVFPLKEKRVGGGNRFFFRPLAARKRTKNSSTSNTNFTRSATRTNWFSLQFCFWKYWNKFLVN